MRDHIDMEKKTKPKPLKEPTWNQKIVIKLCKILITAAEFRRALRACSFWDMTTSWGSAFQALAIRIANKGRETWSKVGSAKNEITQEKQNHKSHKQFYTTDEAQVLSSSSQDCPGPEPAAVAHKEHENYKTEEVA